MNDEQEKVQRERKAQLQDLEAADGVKGGSRVAAKPEGDGATNLPGQMWVASGSTA